jgi:hypothetical protein
MFAAYRPCLHSTKIDVSSLLLQRQRAHIDLRLTRRHRLISPEGLVVGLSYAPSLHE